MGDRKSEVGGRKKPGDSSRKGREDAKGARLNPPGLLLGRTVFVLPGLARLGMKMNLIMPCNFGEPEPVGFFGGAKLIQKPNGYYLLGGTPDDRAAAKEWISMFCPCASISLPSVANKVPTAARSPPGPAQLQLLTER